MLTRRNGIYYYRKAIPDELRENTGRREFIISLKTRDSREALQRGHYVDVYCQDLITRAASGERVLKNGQKLNLGNLLHVQTKVVTVEKPDGTRETTTYREVTPDDMRAMQEVGMSAESIKEIITKEDITATIQRAMRGAGYSEEEIPKAPQQGVTLGEFIDGSIKYWEHNKKREIESRKKNQLSRLAQILGTEKPLNAITADDAADVRDTLAKMPKFSNKYAGIPVRDILDSLEGTEYKRINPTTIERHFEVYRTLFKRAIENNLYSGPNPFNEVEIVAGDHFEQLTEAKRKKEATKTPYTRTDLTKMFSTELFLNFGSQTSHEGVQFWLPLIALLTGSRMSQVASLYCDDITEQDGISIIDFNFNTKDKLAKTGVSYRTVPTHPLLIKLGLVKYAKKVESYAIPSDFGGGSRLFPELRTFSRGSYARRIEDWFNREYLTSLGVRAIHDTKSFHAFRTTLLRMLREAGVNDEFTRNRIIGWSKNETGANNVVREHYDTIELEEMLAALDAINLPPVFDNIPPFPVHRELNFDRKYRNQWSEN